MYIINLTYDTNTELVWLLLQHESLLTNTPLHTTETSPPPPSSSSSSFPIIIPNNNNLDNGSDDDDDGEVSSFDINSLQQVHPNGIVLCVLNQKQGSKLLDTSLSQNCLNDYLMCHHSPYCRKNKFFLNCYWNFSSKLLNITAGMIGSLLDLPLFNHQEHYS